MDDGGLRLRISLENARWIVGHTVRVALPTAKAEIVLAVPRAALLNHGDGDYVFRIGADNKAQRVVVKPGVTNGAWLAVSTEKSGRLNAGDRVVIRGAEGLRPGSTVDILPNPTVGRSNRK
jgi:multidrug efflux pump subunit AcrA (membrane-fusion protein)